MDEKIDTVCSVNCFQWFIYGDTGYNRRHFFDIPGARSNLRVLKRAGHGATVSVRVTVEWMYKEVNYYRKTRTSS